MECPIGHMHVLTAHLPFWGQAVASGGYAWFTEQLTQLMYVKQLPHELV